MDLNLDYLIERIWEELHLIRVFTKRKSEFPNFNEALILRGYSTIDDVVGLR